MHGPLSSELVDAYHRDGFVICADLLADCRDELREMVGEIASWPDSDRWVHHREMTPRGPALARTERFLPYHEGLRKLLTVGAVNRAVAQLFGEPAVVFKEKINYKAPGGAGFHPHQDVVAYPLGSEHITCLVAVDENTAENGCLWFAAGHHRKGVLEVNQEGCLADDVADRMEWQAALVPRGGAVFFSSFTPHKSLANETDQSRRSLYITYNKQSEGDLRSEYYQSRERKLAEQAASQDGSLRISSIGHFQGKGVN